MRKMKNSGVPWIGQIPVAWKVCPLKTSIKWKSEKNHADAMVLSLYRDYGIVPKDSRDDNFNVTSLDTSGYKYVEVGDLVINKMKAWQGSIAVSDYEGIVSPAYHVCQITNESVFKRYLHYLLRNSSYLPEYMRLSTGLRIGQWDLGFDDFKNIPIILPDIDEQKRIVAFLDTECTRIDAVIEQTRTSIEEYKKLKQSVITQAVTKGIRPNRKMKDSGIEWIGEIAEEYNVYKLKYVLRQQLQYGANQSGVPYDELLPRYIRITDITLDGRLKNTGALSLVEEDAQDYILQNNDVLFARSGATVGKAFIYKSEYGRAAFAGYLIRASLKDDLLPDLLFYYTQSSIYDEWKKQIFIQATIQNIGADRYRELPVILQPIMEQREIVSYLKSKCEEIDSLIDRKESLLAELEGYKKSLIYEYVTGKKEVPA
ncbi:MAG: restriction endonuclease subunit S [Firmicutes bacterium]|nr:restriction endonuclease subunit S [Bacillota bacterium]